MCGIGCYDYVGSPGFFDELFFVLISHFHHLVADKIYTHHKNLVAGQHVEIFGGFGYVFYLRHVPHDLYTDTDSVVYTSRSGEWKPELGDYLGDLADEVPDNKIIEFVTGESGSLRFSQFSGC
jgi:hypothetical protein